MTLDKKEKLLLGLTCITAGILTIALKSMMLNAFAFIISILLIVDAIINFIDHLNSLAIVKIVAGIIFLFFGVAFTKAIIYVFSVVLLFISILTLYTLISNKTRVYPAINGIITYAIPILWIVTAIFLILNQSLSLDVFFILIGIYFFLEGMFYCIKGLQEFK